MADYFDVFNNDVQQFLEPSDDRELRGSHIHVDSKVKWLEESEVNEPLDSELEEDDASDDGDLASGSESSSSSDESDSRYFTAEESAGEEERKVRPRSSSLGSYWTASEKSTFFNCLSRYSIHRLDEWRAKLPLKSKLEILMYYRVLRYNLQALQKSNMFGGLLSNEEFPIAYEMDEFYLQFEEFMSRQIRIEYEQPSAVMEDSIVSIDNWNRRWRAIYCKTAIEELVPVSSEPLPYSGEAVQFLTSCAKAYTKRLLWYAVLNELDKLSISKRLLFPEEEMFSNDDLVIEASDNQLPHVVTQSSIYKAVNILKQEGFNTPTLPETVLRTLEKFEVEPTPNGKLFKNRQVTMSLLPTLEQHGAVSPLSIEHQQDRPHHDAELNRIHKKLYTLHHGKKRKIEESFVQDDPLNCIDNPLEFELCDWETQRMEASDKRKSTLYQHALMAYYNDTQENKLTQLQAPPSEDIKPCSVPKIPTSLLNQFLHSNT